MTRCSIAVACVTLGQAAWCATPLLGQDYRLRIDTRIQTVSFRGWTLDSVPADSTAVGPTGGRRYSGYAVRCTGSNPYCTYFTPGPEVKSAPVAATADLTMWGFGVTGLRVHAKARAVGDLESRDHWPGARPAMQLLEGYAEFNSTALTAEAGRMHLSDRFGWRGFDGARVEVRPLGRTVRLGVFGGSALARGFDVPITSSGLNPLAEASWPTKRETLYGGLLAFWTPMAEARAGYQRIDDETTGGVSVERLAMDGRLAIGRNLTITGGADYDLAEASWGTGDLAVTYVQKPGGVSVTVGGRRYQPYFDLWSVWTAFSPVGYTAGSMSLSVPTVKGVELRARGETYAYEDAASNTPLVDVETDGWRWSVGARVTSLDWVTIDAAAHQELGPAAASLGYEGTATVAPMPGLTVSALTSWMRRPLEYRFDDAKVWTYGARAAYAVGGNQDRRLFLDIRRHDETRERADAAELSWDQLRISGGLTINLGSGADRRSLHPSILSLPDVPRSR